MGYCIRVNGDTVFETEGDASLVNDVRIFNHRGEVTVIRSAPLDSYLDIEVIERDARGSDLDLVEARKLQERRDMMELGADRDIEEGTYVKADPETGEPMPEEELVTTAPKKSSKSKTAEEAMENVEF